MQRAPVHAVFARDSWCYPHPAGTTLPSTIPFKAQFLGGKELVTENKFVLSYGCNAVHSGLDSSV